MPRLTLYNYWRSSSSHRVRIALALKGLDYEYVVVRLPEGEQSSDGHRALSPTGYVPCLVVDGLAYVESVAIIELLEDRHPEPPLYPEDAHGRARVRALVEIVNSGIQPFQNISVLAQVAKGAPTATAQEWMCHFVDRGLGAFERAMETGSREGVDGPYAYGAAPTAADVFLVPQVVVAKRIGVSVERYQRVSAAFEAASRLQAFEKASPRNQVDADLADGATGAR
jgi:maleylpyruvate isomerase